jgi:acetyltransferase-like isoleucine patch superfamily enzyme
VGVRAIAKSLAFGAATIAIAPALASFRVRAALFGRDRSFEGSTQALALVPGVLGQYLRRAFLSRVLRQCHPSVTVEFGAIFSRTDAVLEENVYVGPNCHLGLVHLEPNVLLAGGVHIPSGGQTHGSGRLDQPIRDQPGSERLVRIGAGSWVGSAAVVMADVGRDTIVGAGAVVTRPMPDRVVAAGVPARVVKYRDDTTGIARISRSAAL